MQEVADLAGVSLMTVSRVINGWPSVQSAMRESVEAAIRELRFAPNASARRLANGSFRSVAVLLSDPSNAFMGEFLVGAFKAAHENGASLQIEQCGFSEVEQVLGRFEKSGVTGVVLAPSLSDAPALPAYLAHARVPIILAACRPAPGYAAAHIDDSAAAHDMTARLVELGHRRIGFITGASHHASAADRLAGYRLAMRRAVLPFAEELVVGGEYAYASALVAAERLLDLDRPPTAIFASNDEMAAAVISAAHRRGMSVPRDLSVAGVDDIPMAAMLAPALTTIKQPIPQLAELAVGMALELPELDGRRDIIVPHLIVERESTAPPLIR